MKKNEYITIIALFDEYNKSVYTGKALSTFTRYKAVRNYVVDFVNQRYGKLYCSLSEIDTDFITGFEHSKGVSIESVSKMLGHINIRATQ
jgi:hypothetical protein